MRTRRFYRIDKSTAPTEVQMKLAIAQTLAQPFAYNAPVVVLDFEVDKDGGMKGKFKDAARPRVFDFEINGESVSYNPYKLERTDAIDIIQSWEEFSAGFSYRVDAGVGMSGKKPQCVKPTAYNCGAACINIMKSCKIKTNDPTIKDRLKKLGEIGKDYAKTSKPTAKAKKTPTSTPELKPEPKKVDAGVKEQQSARLIGDGTHDGMPKNAEEYHEMMIKKGNKITKEEANEIFETIVDWVEDSDIVRDDQKAGRVSKKGEQITRYIKNATPYKGEIHRGISFDSEEDAMSYLRGDKNNVLDNQVAHASWTSDPKVAKTYTDFRGRGVGQPVIISSINKSGVSIANFASAVEAEDSEVIVSKDVRHKVKNIIKKDGIIYVETEEI